MRGAVPSTVDVRSLLFTLLCLVQPASIGHGSALGQLDPLDQPAPAQPQEQSVLLAVARAGSRLVAAGERGQVLLSDDEGRSWRHAIVPVSSTLTALWFSDARRGWTVGHFGVVLQTRDGGLTWQRQVDGRSGAYSEAMERPLLDVAFVSPQRGFIVGAYGLVLASTDGGESWASWEGHLADPTRRHFYSVRGAGALVLVVGEQGALYRSRDGGDSFTPLPSPYQGSFFGVLASGSRVLVFGLRGRALVSDDQGDRWHPVPTGSTASLTAAGALGVGLGNALVLATSSRELLISRDAGQRWVRSPIDLPVPAQDLIATEDGALVLVGARGPARVDWPGPAP